LPKKPANKEHYINTQKPKLESQDRTNLKS